MKCFFHSDVELVGHDTALRCTECEKESDLKIIPTRTLTRQRIASERALHEVIAAAREVNRAAVERAQVRCQPDPLYRDHMYADARRLDEAFQTYDQSLQPST